MKFEQLTLSRHLRATRANGCLTRMMGRSVLKGGSREITERERECVCVSLQPCGRRKRRTHPFLSLSLSLHLSDTHSLTHMMGNANAVSRPSFLGCMVSVEGRRKEIRRRKPFGTRRIGKRETLELER
jgi:hypothetical protein